MRSSDKGSMRQLTVAVAGLIIALGLMLVGLALTAFFYYALFHFIVKFW